MYRQTSVDSILPYEARAVDMGKQNSNSGAAAIVVFTAVVGAIAVCVANPQVHELYGQVIDGFIHEELDSIRDFVREPTWAGLRAGVQVSHSRQQSAGSATVAPQVLKLVDV